MEEEKAVAIMLANLKGSKVKPSKTSDFALACRTLKMSWGLKQMSDFFHVSTTQLREIDKINDLEPKLKKLADDKKIGITTAFQLSRIDEQKRNEALSLMTTMNRDEIRNFVYFLKTNPGLSVRECYSLLKKSQPTTVKILALPMTDELQKELQKRAAKKRQNIHNYVLNIIEKHLKKD